ncbi:hypothetical protein ILUMI_14270 [Ignelater luminosus]|uniref:Uncharacterized protein n=1 Tax=Ignelater luminosus TaxID=2038154 RepID=A0A8K0CW85_IGNLU|nr:hypothetical protein ILUMI_14270 [Ignelater luminosus]
MTRRGYGYIKIGTWNVRGNLCQKKPELTNELKENQIEIVALTGTKKKGQGVEEADDGNHTAYEGPVGRHGECPSVLSRNEKSTIDLCVANGLIVANKFYPTNKFISTPEFRRKEMKNQL